MTFSIAISTMNKTDEEILVMLENENICSDCIVINQCEKESKKTIVFKKYSVTLICSTERGLSKSRNLALINATTDILLLADDDLFYYENYESIIKNAFLEEKKADILIFNMDNFNKIYKSKNYKCNYYDCFGYASTQIAFKIQRIKENNIFFDTLFGTGSQIFSSGEENIFLSDCYRKKLKIYYNVQKILNRRKEPSSWFHGYTKSFFVDRGAIFHRMSPHIHFFLIVLFAIRKRELNKEYSISKLIYFMLQGRKKHLSLTAQ